MAATLPGSHTSSWSAMKTMSPVARRRAFSKFLL
jgi:hypothetical protein